MFSLAMGTTSCRREQPLSSPKPVVSPRESFDEIMRRFTQSFDGIDVVLPPSRLGRDGPEQQMRMRLVVEDIRYAVHGCNTPQEPCTADLTVRTQSQLSLLDPPDDDESSGRGADSTDAGGSNSDSQRPSALGQRGSGESHDENSRDALAPLSNNELLQSRGIQSEQTYQFAFERGRWVLKSDPQDAIVKRAIESALDGQ
jgi:hypothetical protein